MVLVEGGTFQMGSDNGEDREKPAHRVTVGSFYMGKYEVTQREWTEVMGTTVSQQGDMSGLAEKGRPLRGEGDNYPIYYVNWYEAAEYCNRLSMKEKLTPAYRGREYDMVCDFNASGYRLPTEAEWEYAARGGNKDGKNPYEYSGGNDPDEVAWHQENSQFNTHPVGTKKPNSLGLYDMSGNLWEWCWDWYIGYTGETQTNPTGPSREPPFRVTRGGSWRYLATYARSAARYYNSPSTRSVYLGFRLARSGPAPFDKGTDGDGASAPAAVTQGNMILVKGGTFQMGGTHVGDDFTADDLETPVHTVTVGSFYMARYEVTQGEWAEVMGRTIQSQWRMAGNSAGRSPTGGVGEDYPIYCVNWYEAVEYCNRLSMREKLTPAYRGSGDRVLCDFNATGYRLPTEAEWEYAARGGNKDPQPCEYAGGNNLDEAAWYQGNSGDTGHPVGTKQPSVLGLYDMGGNVWEWCWDRFGSYGSESRINPTGPSGPGSPEAYPPGTDRVHRGGSWGYPAKYARSAYRRYFSPSNRFNYLGFRVARSGPSAPDG
jgi:formylglycine-generating enzyme required for sulfatase activity